MAAVTTNTAATSAIRPDANHPGVDLLRPMVAAAR